MIDFLKRVLRFRLPDEYINESRNLKIDKYGTVKPVSTLIKDNML